MPRSLYWRAPYNFGSFNLTKLPRFTFWRYVTLGLFASNTRHDIIYLHLQGPRRSCWRLGQIKPPKRQSKCKRGWSGCIALARRHMIFFQLVSSTTIRNLWVALVLQQLHEIYDANRRNLCFYSILSIHCYFYSWFMSGFIAIICISCNKILERMEIK